MASVLSIAEEDKFIIRTVKTHIANPADEWANSYEFVSTAAQDETSLFALMEIVAEFEKHIHLATVELIRVSASTWVPDSKPYNPETFISITASGVGDNPDSSAPIGLSNCLAVARVAASGRFGHLFFRGVLTEDAVEAPAGKTVLSDKPAQQAIVDGALDTSGLDAYIGLSHTAEFVLCMINKTGTQVRFVEQLLVQGVSQLPTDHAWFNRTVPSP